MPDNIRYDSNGQPIGYGDPMDPSMYPQQDPAWGQYQQGYTAMPSPQEIYAQQYMDPNQVQPYADPNQPYADPNQMYADPNQMYAQPMQADPYNPYGQSGYVDPDTGMPVTPSYGAMDPGMSGQMPYAEPDPAYMQQGTTGYNQMPQAADPMQMQQYPGMQQGYGQMPQQPQQPQQGQMPQQMLQNQQPMNNMPGQMGASNASQPANASQPTDIPMDKKAAKRAAKEQKRAAKQAASASTPVANMGPAPSSGKATLCLILGVLAVVFALIPPIGIALGLVVRHQSKSYMNAGGRSPRAETGRIFATVGLVFALILLVILIVMGIIMWAGMYGESLARTWAVFYNNSPFGSIIRIPIPSPI